MGFMDKFKDAGKGVLKGALTMAATSYGVVQSGKHKLCKVCMNSTYDKLSFVQLTNIEAEYIIKESIKTFYLHDEDDSTGYHIIKLVYNDGEESIIHLNYQRDQGSALPSAQQRIAAQYEKIGTIVKFLAHQVSELSDETKQWVNKIMRYANMPSIF